MSQDYLDGLKDTISALLDTLENEGLVYVAFKKVFPNYHQGALEYLSVKAMMCMIKGEHIYAIKAVREQYNCGLKEAKDLCDAARNRYTMTATLCPSCGGTGKSAYKVPESITNPRYGSES